MGRKYATGRCFACDRMLGHNPHLVDTRDAQTVFVGSECFKLIKAAGNKGWQPPKGGPRLYLLPKGLTQAEIDTRHKRARSVHAIADPRPRQANTLQGWTNIITKSRR